MADLAAVNVTITKIYRHRVGTLREVMYDVTFGNGVLTYPAGGVPLPALAQFGSLTRVDFFDITPMVVNGYVHMYDKINHTIRKYQGEGWMGEEAMAELPGTHAPPATTLRLKLQGK